MKDLVNSWFLAALSYDEARVQYYVRELLPGLKTHFRATKHGNHFYGVALDDKNGRMWIVNRGTDGYNKMGSFMSWGRNFRMLTSGDGVHNGFQDAGNRVIDEFKEYIYNYDTCYVCGHSQGAGVAQYQLVLLAENFSNLKTIHGDIFAAPPAGNKIFKKRFNDHVKAGKISLDRYVVTGDPIDSNFLRNPASFILNGVDVGNEITLPKIIRYDLKVANVVKHSPLVYNAGLLLRCTEDGTYKRADLKMFSEIGKRIVN